MKTKLIALWALVTCLALPARAEKIEGNGNIITKEISVQDYNAVQIGNSLLNRNGWSLSSLFSGNHNQSYAFEYTQGNEPEIRITIDENLYPYLNVKVDKQKLSITAKANTQLSPTKLKIEGSSKRLEEIDMSGSMDFILRGPLSGDKLKVEGSGGSDIKMKHPVRLTECNISASGGADIMFSDLSCQRIKAACSGGSDIDLKGNAEEGSFDTSGGSDLKAYGMSIKRVKCDSSGGSDIYVRATETLDASASGGSDIHYKGNPQVSKSASGGADITKSGD